jgi:hypothetical protein
VWGILSVETQNFASLPAALAYGDENTALRAAMLQKKIEPNGNNKKNVCICRRKNIGDNITFPIVKRISEYEKCNTYKR